jgi:hypothetical protein
VGIGRSATRIGLLAAGVAAAMVVAACGSTDRTVTNAASINPLTATIPASTIPADTPVEPGIFRLTGQPSLALDLVRSGAVVAAVEARLGDLD